MPHDNESNTPTTDSAETLAYIEQYQPARLTSDQWRRHELAVRALALATEPVSPTDAKTVLSAICGFLDWSESKLGPLPVSQVLTDDHVTRHIVELTSSQTAGTCNNVHGRLKRVLRVQHGEPARTKRQPRSAAARALTDAELASLSSIARTCPAVSLLLSAMDSFTGAPAAFEQATSGDAQQWAVTRQAAAEVSVLLRKDRLRATWIVRRLAGDVPLVQTLRDAELTRSDLETAKDNAPAVDLDRYRRYLRG